MRCEAAVVSGALAIASLAAQAPGTPVGVPIEERIRDGQQALAEHRYEEAAEQFEAILAVDASLGGAHANLGVAKYLLQDYERAAVSFRRALEIDPGMQDAELYLGLSLARAGVMDEALPPLARGFWNATDNPWRLQAGILLAELFAARQEDRDLLNVVSALQAAFPQDPDVLYLAYRLHTDLGARAISDLAREAPGSARLHQVTAELLTSEGDFPRAARQYREALEIDPQLAGANRGLAVAILNSNPDAAGLQEARAALERELSLNPRDAESLYQLGEIAWQGGDQETALQHYARAVELQPRFVEGQVALGKALLAMDDVDQATRQLEQAVEVDPENEVAHYRLAQAYRRSDRADDAAAALEEFRRIRSTAEALGAIYRQVQRSTVPSADSDSGAGQ